MAQPHDLAAASATTITRNLGKGTVFSGSMGLTIWMDFSWFMVWNKLTQSFLQSGGTGSVQLRPLRFCMANFIWTLTGSHQPHGSYSSATLDRIPARVMRLLIKASFRARESFRLMSGGGFCPLRRLRKKSSLKPRLSVSDSVFQARPRHPTCTPSADALGGGF